MAENIELAVKNDIRRAVNSKYVRPCVAKELGVNEGELSLVCQCDCNCTKCRRPGPKDWLLLNKWLEKRTYKELFTLLKDNGHFEAMKLFKNIDSIDSTEFSEAFSFEDPIDIKKVALRNLSYEEVIDMCNGMDENSAIGRGGFGDVFKGKFYGQEVAIKRLKDSSFFVELKVAYQFRCKNIITLMAISFHGRNSPGCLIYEFMPNGSVFDRLNGKNLPSGLPGPYLNGQQRGNIAMGTASGLHYLHEQLIHHGDIKSNNILLDVHMEPKIADCGLARGLDANRTSKLLQTVSGSPWYLPNDFQIEKKLCPEVDVFCYGRFLFELFTGISPISYDNGEEFRKMTAFMENYPMNVEGFQFPMDKADTKFNIPDLLAEAWYKCLFMCGKDCTKPNRHNRAKIGKVETFWHERKKEFDKLYHMIQQQQNNVPIQREQLEASEAMQTLNQLESQGPASMM